MRSEPGVHPSVQRQNALTSHQRWAYVMAAVALVAGAALLPRGDELLLIHLRNHDSGRARQALADGANLGISNAASVAAHSELYVFEGRVDDALEELERYVESHPDQADAWARLAHVNENAQRLHDQIRALENVYRLAPSEALARRLAALHRWTGDERGEATRLRDLVVRDQAGVAEYIRSARLAAAFGRREEALDDLERLRRRNPRAFAYGEIELYASLLIDLGRAELLSPRLQGLPRMHEEPALLEQLATAIRGWGRIDAALALLDPLHGVAPSPMLLAVRARTAVGTSEAGRVSAELADADARGPLTSDVLEAFVQLALTIPDYDAIERVLSAPGRDDVSEPLTTAISYAVSHGARHRAQRLIARLGDDALAGSPMLALELAVERGDRNRAEFWIAAIDEGRWASPEQIAALAQFESTLGLDARAFDRLTSLASSGRAPDWALGDLTTAATRLGREDEALHTLGALSSRSPSGRDAWIRLAATSGRTDIIEDWFASGPPRADDGRLLRDVFYLLSDRHLQGLAVTAAERLLAATNDTRDALRLGQALLAAGRTGEALSPLRRSRHDSEDAARVFDLALAAAQAAGEDVAGELRPRFQERLKADLPDDHRALLVEGLWSAGARESISEDLIRLARLDPDRWLAPLVESTRSGGSESVRRDAIALVEFAIGQRTRSEDGVPPDPREENLVRALVDLDAPDAVLLPHLERLAHGLGGTWIYAYDERLQRDALTDRRRELWAQIGGSRERPIEERRAAASRLVEIGATDRAAEVLEQVAADAGPAEPDVQQLVWLWGRTPGERQVRWLLERLQRAPDEERPAWIGHIVAAGGAAHIVERYSDLPPGATSAFISAWIDAHRARGDRRRLARAIEAVLARGDLPPSTLQHIARTARSEGLNEHARQAYLRDVATEPAHLEALQSLGALAFYDGRTAEARTWLQAYLNAGGNDAEPLYQMGELTLASHDRDAAMPFFTRSRDALTSAGDAANQVLLANVLVRLDDRDRARAIFESTLIAAPGLEHVRADYAAALMQWRDWEHAADVLRIDEPTRTHGAGADASGARRLDLLRVQWLTHHGRYAETLQVLERLAVHFPTDPDVLLARGRFDADRGRVAQAERHYEAARLEAPSRDDIQALLNDLGRARSPRAGLQMETRSVGSAWDERSTRASIAGRVQPHLPVSISMDRLVLSAPRAPHADGTVTPLDVSLSRFDATATLPVSAGTTVTTSLMGATGSLGAGVTVTHHDVRGVSIVVAEHGRPFWELLESVAGGGLKDRVGVQRQWRFRPDSAAWALVDLNTYRLSGGERASTAALGLGFVHTIRQARPAVTLQYGLDKEHRRSGTVATAADGRSFTPVPLASREVHLFGASSRFNALHLWEAEATGGYTIDRLGGRGAFLTGRLTPRPTAVAGIEIWAERRLYTITTTEHVFRAGAGLTVRF